MKLCEVVPLQHGPSCARTSQRSDHTCTTIGSLVHELCHVNNLESKTRVHQLGSCDYQRRFQRLVFFRKAVATTQTGSLPDNERKLDTTARCREECEASNELHYNPMHGRLHRPSSRVASSFFISHGTRSPDDS